MNVLILGVNGFIGSHLTARLLRTTDWHVYGLDLAADRLEAFLDHPRLHYIEGDVSISHEWIDYHIKKCDVCLPLVAIATPAMYVRDPLGVFELDFEENLRIVRQACRFGTRVVFPSTSEVYGMCPDPVFSEESSPLVYGPISKQRWIYACSKQLLDRVIWAMGRQRGLRFTLIRPFNWIGPGLDSLESAKEGSSRVVTQFLDRILRGEPIPLVDGGLQRRSFTYVDDGIDALVTILKDRGERTNGRIFNLGNPGNDVSIRRLAELMVEIAGEILGRPLELRTTEIEGRVHYGEDYEDMRHRVPDIRLAREVLGWEPKVDLREALRRTMEPYLAGRTVGEESRIPDGATLAGGRQRVAGSGGLN